MTQKAIRKNVKHSLSMFSWVFFFIGYLLFMIIVLTPKDNVVCAATPTMVSSSGTLNGNWKYSSNKWWYQYENNQWAVGWKQIDNKWYFFDKDGWMKTGWLQKNNHWYFLHSSGAMAEGWLKQGRTWYFLTPNNGAMKTGWFTDSSGTWYYTDSSGAMRTGWLQTNNRWYFLHSSGAMAEGWLKQGNIWYYLTPNNGAMKIGWFTDSSSTWYYADSSGAMLTNRWIGNYYVGNSGAMATSCWIGQYYVDSNGKWLPNGPTEDNQMSEHNHKWKYISGVEKIKSGYACNGCYRDISDWEDLYNCCGSFHTHQWYLYPTFYTCETCKTKKHEHNWSYIEPEYISGTNEIFSDEYWICYACGNQSSDGKTTEPIYVSEKGFKRGARNHWVTPYDFGEDNSEKWVLVNNYWEPPADKPTLQGIDITGSYSLSPGDTGKYNVTFTPTAAIEKITWKSSNNSIISIDTDGKYHAHAIGTAQITATSASGYTNSIFVRVTQENIGVIKNATLLVNGKSTPNSEIILEKNEKKYPITLQTEPAQAIYTVDYKIEDQESIPDYSIYSHSIWISGSSLLGNTSIYSWENDPEFTNSESQITTGKAGTATIIATITDMNGNVTVLKQPVIIQ